jgi:hypothetical protein
MDAVLVGPTTKTTTTTTREEPNKDVLMGKYGI